jgi:hypothetical protein
MMILNYLEGLAWISDINEHNLSEAIANEDILTPCWMNFYDSDGISLELFSLFHEAVVWLLGFPIVHPEFTQ